MKRLFFAVGAIVALILAGTAGYFLARHAASPEGSATARSERKVLYWYAPMNPDQHFDQPGLSPMGMELLPKYADEAGGGEAGVRIDPGTLQNLGVTTAVVERGTLKRNVRAPATLAWNLREAVTVSARANGVLDKLYVRAPFEPVKAGQPLAALIAPEWNAAAQEYLALAQAQSSDARALRSAARARLRALGMDAAQIRALRGGDAQIVLRAPADGVVSALEVREGQQVGAGTPLMTINGLDSVWLEAAIPQGQTHGIGAGTPVTATVSALPGKTFHGKVEELLPDVDGATRTQRARIVLDNPEHALAPGMYARVRIAGSLGQPHPLVPDAALIGTGSETRVIVAEGDGRFRPVAVRIGAASDGQTEILTGLDGGERVVTSGQFLIDSEASLSGALERLSAPADSGHGEGSRETGTSSGAARHPRSQALRGQALLPVGEGKATSMHGMPMPAAASSGAQP